MQSGQIEVALKGPETALDEMNRIAGLVHSVTLKVYEDSRDLDLLEPEFKDHVKMVLARCQQRGFVLKPFYTIRTPWTQAKLWRQSRPTQEIQRMTRKLENDGADYLAYILQSVGPQTGRWATNALPGQSWHQWGQAVDCFLLSPKGQAIWAAKHAGYECYATEARALGLTAGYFWDRVDAVHIQAPAEPSPRTTYSWAEINAAMKTMFPEKQG